MLPGPDFPTGGIVIDDGSLATAYGAGRGTIRVRARAEVARSARRRQGIVVTELPLQRRARAGHRPHQRAGRLAGSSAAVTDVKDLSDRKKGLRIQIECNAPAPTPTPCWPSCTG